MAGPHMRSEVAALADRHSSRNRCGGRSLLPAKLCFRQLCETFDPSFRISTVHRFGISGDIAVAVFHIKHKLNRSSPEAQNV